MSFNKTIKEENASVIAHTIGDLIRNFNIELDEFLIERLDKFPIDDKLDIVYDNYYVIELENNLIHAFNGSVTNVPESPEYTIMLDLKHDRVYYMGQSAVNNSIHEYSGNGELLSEVDYGLKPINADEFIRTHFIDYSCKTVNDLLVNFNLDFELSDKLKQHNLDADFDVVFNEFFIQNYDGIDYYVFPSSFQFVIVMDVDEPIYYIDPVNQKLYVQTGGMLGISVNVFDSNDVYVETMCPVDYYHGEFDIGKILSTDKEHRTYLDY